MLNHCISRVGSSHFFCVQDDPPQDEDSQKTEPITGWDAEFVKVDQATLFEMILAATQAGVHRQAAHDLGSVFIKKKSAHTTYQQNSKQPRDR